MPKAKENSGLQSAQEKQPKYEHDILDGMSNPDTPEGMRYPQFTIKSEGAVYLLYVKDGKDPGADSAFWNEVVLSLIFMYPLRPWARNKMLEYGIPRLVGLPVTKEPGRPSPLHRNARILVSMDRLLRKQYTLVQAAELLETVAKKASLVTAKGKPLTAAGILSAYSVARATFFVRRIPDVEVPKFHFDVNYLKTRSEFRNLHHPAISYS